MTSVTVEKTNNSPTVTTPTFFGIPREVRDEIYTIVSDETWIDGCWSRDDKTAQSLNFLYGVKIIGVSRLFHAEMAQAYFAHHLFEWEIKPKRSLDDAEAEVKRVVDNGWAARMVDGGITYGGNVARLRQLQFRIDADYVRRQRGLMFYITWRAATEPLLLEMIEDDADTKGVLVRTWKHADRVQAELERVVKELHDKRQSILGLTVAQVGMMVLRIHKVILTPAVEQ